MLCGEDQLLWDDYERVQKFFDCPLSSIHEFTNLKNEFTTMFKHIDRHANEVVFVRCEDRICCSRWRSDETMMFLQKFNGRLFAPTLSSETGRYNTFLQSYSSRQHEHGDPGQPTTVQKNLGKCSICPR